MDFLFVSGFLVAILIVFVVSAFSKEGALVLSLFGYYITGFSRYIFGENFASGFSLYAALTLIWLLALGGIFRRRSYFGWVYADFIVLLIPFVSAVFIFNSSNYMDGAVYTAKLIYGVALPYFIVRLLYSSEKISAEKLGKISVFIWFCVSVVALLLGGEQQGRLTVPETNSIYFSLLSAQSALLTIVFLMDKSHVTLLNRFLYFGLFLFFAYTLVSSGGKGGVLSLLMGITLFALLKLLSIFSKVRMSRSGFIISILVIFFTVPISAYTYSFFSENRSISGIKNLISGDFGASGYERFSLISNHYQMFLVNPVFGTGPGTVANYPHNIILELIFTFGVLGFILALSILLKSAFVSIKFYWRSDVESNVVATLVVISLIAGMFSFSIWMLSFLFVGLALTVSARRARG